MRDLQGVGKAEQVRVKVLDAGRRCLEASGLQRVSMSALAAEAEISRATLYRHFESRDEVLKAVVIHETRRRLDRIVVEARAEAELGDALLAFVRLTLDVSKDDPVIISLIGSDALRFTQDALLESSVELFEIISEAFARLVEGREHELRPGLSIDEASEWTLRVVLSFLTVRSPMRRSGDGLDAYLMRFFLPVMIASEV